MKAPRYDIETALSSLLVKGIMCIYALSVIIIILLAAEGKSGVRLGEAGDYHRESRVCVCVYVQMYRYSVIMITFPEPPT